MRQAYGDVRSEYSAIRENAALVEGAHEVVWVTGPDSVGFLDGILSQDVAGVPEYHVARTLFLGPQGKLRALLWIARGVERVALVVDGGQGESLAGELGYYRIRVKADITFESRDIWEVWGPDAHLTVPGTAPGEWADLADGIAISIGAGALPRVLVIGAEPPELTPAGVLATSAVRAEIGEPVFGVDVDEKTIPQETGLVGDAVSFTKGCYLGQELVARIDTRGHVNRHLRRLELTPGPLPPEGAAVHAGDDQVGTITSVSPAPPNPTGLSLLRREVAVGDRVEIAWNGGETTAFVRDFTGVAGQ